MTKLPRGTITVPITFYEHSDIEQIDIMVADGMNHFVAQTHQAINNDNPKALREVPQYLDCKKSKIINVKDLHTKATNDLKLAKIKLLAFPQSTQYKDIIQKLSSQIDFYERIQAAEGKECESIIILY